MRLLSVVQQKDAKKLFDQAVGSLQTEIMPDANKTLPAPLPPSVVRLVELLKQRLEPEQIILFGSRARGDFRIGSDVDLSVKGVRCSDRDWNICLNDVSTEP